MNRAPTWQVGSSQVSFMLDCQRTKDYGVLTEEREYDTYYLVEQEVDPPRKTGE